MKKFFALLCVSLLFPKVYAAASAGSRAPSVALESFNLVGEVAGERAAFTLTATARVEGKGATLALLSGPVALTDLGPHPQWRVRVEQNCYLIEFEHGGKVPIRLQFDAAVKPAELWKTVEFHVAPGVLQPLVLRGLGADTQFDFPGAARPERKGSEFITYLPSDGTVKLSWKEAKPEAEGKLFYAAEMLAQVSVSPGLMRQVALLNFKVMQGELGRVSLRLRGAGEVTRVQGEQVLAWNVEPVPGSTERRLVVQLNQPQKDQFALQVQAQTPLGAFPQTADAMQLRPEGATRFAGYVRIVNEGAVRLEVAQASGLSQISPEQFPESDATRAALRLSGSQRFAYRFSGGDFGLRIQADQILPELSVSQVLVYRLGENEQTIDAEFELDIREAPLRELVLLVPKGYAIARLSASGLSDYFVREPEEQTNAELRLVYGQPMSGRQLVQLLLERNQSLGQPSWSLPRLEVAKAKSVRGHVGVAADAGFRLTPERTGGLTELATAFFPRKVAGLQAAFRLSEPGWQASLRVERLPQTVQADVFHLFSVGEGIAYGSSVFNYVISGAPVSTFRLELSDEFLNVEFTGKDIRGSQKTEGGYVVQLHTPVSGAYTLLATYERPFKAQGETLAFSGARSLDAQSEQGYALVISAYQFRVKPADVSGGLLSLEPGEVPAEYRLFFDAPILAAYRYTSRPFNLKLALSPLAQGDSLSQVVDRAALTTRISKEGQVLTDARYFVKNHGHPNFRLTLPAGMALWSASVNGAAVVPVTDVAAELIPLPQSADPNAVFTIDLKLASKSKESQRLSLGAPIVNAPVMLAEWKLEPDTGQRLIYRRGSLSPLGGVPDVSGFAELTRTFTGEQSGEATTVLLAGLVLVAAGLVLWRWAGQAGGYRLSPRHVLGTALGALALLLGGLALARLGSLFAEQRMSLPNQLSFLAPVQQAGGILQLEVGNVEDRVSVWDLLGYAWPALLALVAWGYGLLGSKAGPRMAAGVAGWTLLAWAALRSPNGAEVFLLVIAAFLALQVVIPAMRGPWQLPRRETAPTQAANGSAAAATTALLLGGLVWLGAGPTAVASETAGGSWTADFADSADKPEKLSVMLWQDHYGSLPFPQSNLYRRGAKHAEILLRSSSLRTSRLCGLSGAASPVSPRLCSPSAPHTTSPSLAAIAESVTQDVRIEDKFVVGTARIRWQAEKGEILALLLEPAVLTQLNYPSNALKLAEVPAGSKVAQQVVAERAGTFDLEMHYEVQVSKRDSESWFPLPVLPGLVNRLKLTAVNLDVDVLSPQAVFVQRDTVGSNTVASLTLSPAKDTWVAWKPRSRDVKREKPVFYADVSQLYVPAAGVVEGAHYVSIRPAQGELSELVLDVPPATSITDVLEPSRPQGASGPLVSLWRFDPDTRKLRVTLSPAQSRPFALLVRSQVAAGPLPFEQSLGLLSVESAAGQLGLLGIATDNEVQLDSVGAGSLSPINLEDFPNDVAAALQAQIPGLTVRRAFRYGDSQATVSLKASAVEPDVRVETQDTLSLGEDRVVLAVNATADITRAGIFRLSFLMPAGFDVESISGSALSHWTESKSDTGRLVTLHLAGKTQGQQQFTLSLSGPGVKTARAWAVPQVVLREANKQRGTLLVVPEQGMRLQAATQDGITQLDPQKSGIRQKGVLAFRVLQTPWKLALDVEQVDAWIQVTSLQQATVSEAQVKVAANLQYQIENTGLKTLRVFVPTNADNVRFQGEQVSDCLPVAGVVTNGLQEWEIKLGRRIIGPYLLQATYQTLMPERAPDVLLRGVRAGDVNFQRGFVTVQSAGRLQVQADNVPDSLKPTEWQGIPRALKKDMPAAAANFAFRLVEPDFALPLKLERHQAAELLAGRINSITFRSVISDAGVMLTHARLELVPGDKRLLAVTLPNNAQFWFAFVNQNGVWPWREQDRILIPLDQQAQRGKTVPVELFFSCAVTPASGNSLDLDWFAPKFDLPLENLTWRVSLGEKWHIKKWSGSLQLQHEEVIPQSAAVDVQAYLQDETTLQLERIREAEGLMAEANTALEQGEPQQARRAFQAAYGLSAHDAAFNEDARVQLHNIKLQEALVGLNVRQAAVAGDPAALGARFHDLHSRKELSYTQQDAKDILDRNTSDDNAACMRLAEKLIQQQDAAVSSASPIRASIPEQGRVLTFKRAVVVDPWADLRVTLRASATRTALWGAKLMILGGAVMILGLFAWSRRRI